MFTKTGYYKNFFVFHPFLMKLGEVVVLVTHWPLCVLQFHQVLSKSDEKQKGFINSPFFCSEFQMVSRIVKIVHSAKVYIFERSLKFINNFNILYRKNVLKKSLKLAIFFVPFWVKMTRYC